MNRITAMIGITKDAIAKQVAAGTVTKAKLADLGRTLDMDFVEHAKFQSIKSLACANGTLTTDEGMTIFAALGGSPTVFNKRDVATKVVLTKLFHELLQERLKAS